MKALHENPLATEEILEEFYRPSPDRGARTARAGSAARTSSSTATRPKPTHYKIVCISLYTEDIQRLEALVAELKRRGHSKANKSQLIRAALDQVDLDRIPRGY